VIFSARCQSSALEARVFKLIPSTCNSKNIVAFKFIVDKSSKGQTVSTLTYRAQGQFHVLFRCHAKATVWSLPK
jgi:hypothetical protein